MTDRHALPRAAGSIRLIGVKKNHRLSRWVAFICPDSVSLPRFFSYTYILLGINIYICVNYVTTFSYISCILWGMYLLYIIFSSNIVIEIIINGVIDEDAYNFSII